METKLELNKIYNEDCMITMNNMITNNQKVDLILTSPPYNTGRLVQTKKSFDTYNNRYDIYLDNKSEEEYINWSIDLFNSFNKILNNNSVVLYNISYGSENNINCLWLLVAEIIKKTNFMVADCIIWKKKSALPNNVSSNKLTRITEFVFVFCRKEEYDTFNVNKKVISISEKGQKFYENIFNFILADNNDGFNELNKATYSTELCDKLLNIYAKENSIIYDPFIGSGTTAIASIVNKMKYIGSELSENQVIATNKRINNINKNTTKDLSEFGL